MDSTVRETINELNKMNDIYKYNDNDAGIKGDLYISKEVYLDASVLDGILDKKGVFTGGTKLSDLLTLKLPLHRDTATKQIELNYNTDEFKIGPAPNGNLEINTVPGNKVDINFAIGSG